MLEPIALLLMVLAVAAEDSPYRLSSEELLGPSRRSHPKEQSMAWEWLKAKLDGKRVQAAGEEDGSIVILPTDKRDGVSFRVVFRPSAKQHEEIKSAKTDAAKKKKELRITVTGVCKFEKLDNKQPTYPLMDEFPYSVSIEKPTIELSLR